LERKKEKIIEIILGESNRLEKNEGYERDELEKEKLLLLPYENLQIIDKNQKNAWKRKKRKEKRNATIVV
jgi:hypothetical protein